MAPLAVDEHGGPRPSLARDAIDHRLVPEPGAKRVGLQAQADHVGARRREKRKRRQRCRAAAIA